jgi:putative transposase
VQFAVQAERTTHHEPTGRQVGIALRLTAFLADSDGDVVANLRKLPKAETRLQRLNRRVSRKKKGSTNQSNAVRRLAKGYLKVGRRRQDVAGKIARSLIQSHDLVA